MPSTTEDEDVAEWIRRTASPIVATDPSLPPTDLTSLDAPVSRATVVGLGGETRGARELCVLQHRILRFLVQRHGFRSLALEMDWSQAVRLDQYLRTGAGDPRAQLVAAARFWQTEELLEVIGWLRSFNVDHPGDQVRLVGLDFDAIDALAYDAVTDYVRRAAPDRLAMLDAHYADLRPSGPIAEHVRWYLDEHAKQPLLERASAALALVDALPPDAGHALAVQHARAIVDFYEYHAGAGMGYVEEQMAKRLIWWQEQSSHTLIYWGAFTHTSNGDPRSVSFGRAAPSTDRNAGSYLRDRFGPAYLSVGLTLDHGAVASFGGPAPLAVPAPSPEHADALLGSQDLPAYVLDLHGPHPRAVQTWLEQPARLRLLGPLYDPEHDAEHHMSGGSLADWFDVVVHCQEVTPTRPLG